MRLPALAVKDQKSTSAFGLMLPTRTTFVPPRGVAVAEVLLGSTSATRFWEAVTEKAVCKEAPGSAATLSGERSQTSDTGIRVTSPPSARSSCSQKAG